ncbi:hypothetical protein AHAS_Ahas12G0203700 [Arachis hypogaea]
MGEGLLPDNFTLPCAVKAYTRFTEVELGEVLHALALKMVLCSDSFVGNVLIAIYGSVPNVATMVTMVLVVAAMGKVNLGMLFHGLALILDF